MIVVVIIRILGIEKFLRIGIEFSKIFYMCIVNFFCYYVELVGIEIFYGLVFCYYIL